MKAKVTYLWNVQYHINGQILNTVLPYQVRAASFEEAQDKVKGFLKSCSLEVNNNVHLNGITINGMGVLE